ncbi:MAG: hypothetical protein JKY54_10560, partial [Flavobacteriales bacterium]|nr:hypothetical protein [Flavobacteriales bacterium]
MKINGVTTNNFTYNVVSKVMSISTSLVEGTNVFSIVATNSVGTDNAGTTVIYKKKITLGPPIISITKPIFNPYNTVISNEVIYATVLNVPGASNIGATFNGVSTNAFSYDPATKKFTYNANLIPGANILEITAWNIAGTAAKSQTIIYTNEAPPCNDPVITITQPASSPFIVTTPKGAVIGKITGAQSIQVKINGVVTPGYNFNNTTGAFELFDNSPQEGANVYEITAINNCGQVHQSVTIIYNKQSPPCIEPSIELVSPSSYSTSTIATTFNFPAFARNVATKSKITLTLNGTAIPFTFNVATKLTSANLTLTSGANVLIIKGTNDCGADMATIRIDERRVIGGGIQALPPTVVITTPSTETYISPTPATTVIAKVQRVTSESEISTNFEGTAVPFTYNAALKTVTVTLVLTEGSHTLEIGVANANGSASDAVELVYELEEVPCDAPVITMDPQFNSRLTIHSGGGTITGIITNAKLIVVKRDGSNYTDFSYDAISGSFVIHYSSLHKGNNVFKIAAHSECGKDFHTVLLDFDVPTIPCDKPTLVIAEASGISVTVTVDNGMFTAHVGGATSVEVLKGGSAYSNFTYDLTSGNMVINYTGLNPGANIFTVKAINDCGKTVGTYTITYDAPVPCTNPVVTMSSATYAVTALPYVVTVATTDAVSVSVTLNGAAFSGYTFSTTTGQVLITMNALNPKANTIVVTAQNDCGTTSASTIVTYTVPPCDDPVIALPSAATAGVFPVATLPYAMTIATTNATSVNVTLNGAAFSGYTFSTTTGNVQVNINALNAGPNMLVVTAQNDCGSVNATADLIYAVPPPPCVDPVVTLPASASAGTYAVTTLPYTLTVATTNATSVTITLNGTAYSGYTFSAATGNVQVNVSSLNTGANAMVITALNDCGSVNATANLAYTATPPPCVDPVITLPASASAGTYVVTTFPYALTITTSNATSVNVTLNGATYSGYTFSAATGNVQVNLNSLNVGANTLVITALNDCGSANATANLTYTATPPPCVDPVVTLPSSATAGVFAVTVLPYAITIATTNATSVNVTLNGATYSGYTFS